MSTFVLVPGAGGSAWPWHRVGSALEQRGHVAASVELPGDDPTKGWATRPTSSSPCADGLGECVLVAHSMAALSAPLAVDRLPVAALVLLNAMVPAPGETGGQWWSATDQPAARAASAAREAEPTPTT